jgi:hypothetical protein
MTPAPTSPRTTPLRVVRLDELHPAARRVVLALIDAHKSVCQIKKGCPTCHGVKVAREPVPERGGFKPFTDSGHCAFCGRHQSWGCAFECPEKKPPVDIAQYPAWADEQKLGYMRKGMG